MLPQSRIESLSQGFFFGKIADDFEHPILKKLFCAQIQIDIKGNAAKEKLWKKLPKGGAKYFDLDKIEAEVRSDDGTIIKEYMYAMLKKEQGDLEARDITYSPDTSVVLREKVENAWAEMNDADREKLTLEVIDKRQIEVMKRVVDQNYKQIQEDIKEIFQVENVPMVATSDEEETIDESDEQAVSEAEGEDMSFDWSNR